MNPRTSHASTRGTGGWHYFGSSDRGKVLPQPAQQQGLAGGEQ